MTETLNFLDASLTIGQQRDWPIHSLFESQVDRIPRAEALVSSAERLTYVELNQRANRLAHFMCDRGLRRGDLVGIALPRTTGLIVALLATLKSGASYVPLDPSYPTERVNFMLTDSGCRFVLTTSDIASRVTISASEVVKLDQCTTELSKQRRTNPGVPVGTEDLAYVMYTSGSTGKPKGVAIEHRSLATFMQWVRACFSATELDGVLAATSICFDLSVFEIFASLCWGGRVVLAKTVLELGELPHRNEVKLVNTVPSAMRELLTLGALPDSVCTICLAGEAFPGALVRQLRAVEKPLRVLNLYGPTEDTIYSTFAQVDLTSDAGPPIGRPLPGTRAYVVDKMMQLCPEGVAGELLLGGDGLARGYFGRPELTAERFLPDRFSDNPADRVYRTGDRVSVQPDGQLAYLGRVDDQVKIRGYRIELGEVERALSDIECKAEWIVTAVDEPGGDRGLAAYFSGHVTFDRLRERLAQVLPKHMIPSIFVKLDNIPRTPNGKLDRHRLPAPDWSTRLETPRMSGPPNGAAAAVLSGQFVAPLQRRALSGVEARLLEFCRDILAYPHLEVDESLLEAGFHSLSFTQLAGRIRSAFGVSPPFSELFERHTVAELASLVEAGTATGDAAPEPVAASHNTGDPPLSFAQERVWFLEKLHPGSLAYHFQSVLRFHGLLDIRALQAALNELVKRHEILRTSFPAAAGRPYQRIHPFASFTLPVEDALPEEAEQRIMQFIRTLFDFERVPPVRWILFRLAPDEHWLLHAEHHLLHDGWEYEIFLRELFACYDALLKGQKLALPPLTVQFADFAIWQRQQLAAGCWDGQLAYWEKRLHGAPPAAQLPADRARPAATFSGSQLRHAFAHEFYAQLVATSAREGVTPYMWLQAAFHAFLLRYTAQTDIIVGSVVANRQSAEAQKLLGMILNTVALRLNVSGELSFREHLSCARRVILEALDNQDIPFDHVVRRVGPGTQLFNTFFDTYDRSYPSYHSDVLRVERHDVLNNGSCKFDLVVHVIPGEATPAIVLWEYNTDLFTEETAARMLRHFLTLLMASVANPDLPVAALPLRAPEEPRSVAPSEQFKHPR